MLKRLAALLLAVALVAGAWVLRSRLVDGGNGDGGAGGTTTTTSAGPFRLICVTELDRLCRALAADDGVGVEVVVEPAGTTRDRLGAADATVPGAWLTLDPWPAMVDEARQRSDLPPAFADVERLASSRPALVVRAARTDELVAACGGTIDWPCLGSDRAATVKLGLGSAADSASGAVVYGNGVASLFPDQDPATLATIDLQASDEFPSWSRTIGQAAADYASAPRAPLDDLVLLPRLDVVGAIEAEYLALQVADADRFTLLYPDPVARADAVLAVADGTRLPDGLDERIRNDLRASGWQEPGDGPAPGLPSPGLTEALRATWRETTT